MGEQTDELVKRQAMGGLCLATFGSAIFWPIFAVNQEKIVEMDQVIPNYSTMLLTLLCIFTIPSFVVNTLLCIGGVKVA